LLSIIRFPEAFLEEIFSESFWANSQLQSLSHFLAPKIWIPVPQFVIKSDISGWKTEQAKPGHGPLNDTETALDFSLVPVQLLPGQPAGSISMLLAT
jgi:hypothetical protein